MTDKNDDKNGDTTERHGMTGQFQVKLNGGDTPEDMRRIVCMTAALDTAVDMVLAAGLIVDELLKELGKIPDIDLTTDGIREMLRLMTPLGKANSPEREARSEEALMSIPCTEEEREKLRQHGDQSIAAQYEVAICILSYVMGDSFTRSDEEIDEAVRHHKMQAALASGDLSAMGMPPQALLEMLSMTRDGEELQ